LIVVVVVFFLKIGESYVLFVEGVELRRKRKVRC